jgi:hypothetical protein
MQVDDGLVTVGQLSIDGIVGLVIVGKGKPYPWLPVYAWLVGYRLWVDRGLDVISRLINDWIVEMMVSGNRKPYALERPGHLSTLCSRRVPVANPSGYFGLRVI